MKTNRLVWTVSMFLVFFLVSCAANLEVKKNQEEAFRNLGEGYMGQGDYTIALRELLKAEKLYAKDPRLQYDIGLTYLAKGKPYIAIDHFKKAIKIKPDYTSAKNSLGAAYLDQKKWDVAIACFKGIIDDILYVTPHYPLTNLGWAYYNKQEYELAEKYYLDALKLEPTFIIALRGLGRTYMAMEMAADAIMMLEKAVKNYPRSAESYFYLAKAYSLSRKYKKAINSYNKIIELAPDSPFAIEAQQEAKKIKNLQ